MKASVTRRIAGRLSARTQPAGGCGHPPAPVSCSAGGPLLARRPYCSSYYYGLRVSQRVSQATGLAGGGAQDTRLPPPPGAGFEPCETGNLPASRSHRGASPRRVEARHPGCSPPGGTETQAVPPSRRQRLTCAVRPTVPTAPRPPSLRLRPPQRPREGAALSPLGGLCRNKVQRVRQPRPLSGSWGASHRRAPRLSSPTCPSPSPGPEAAPRWPGDNRNAHRQTAGKRVCDTTHACVTDRGLLPSEDEPEAEGAGAVRLHSAEGPRGSQWSGGCRGRGGRFVSHGDGAAVRGDGQAPEREDDGATAAQRRARASGRGTTRLETVPVRCGACLTTGAAVRRGRSPPGARSQRPRVAQRPACGAARAGSPTGAGRVRGPLVAGGSWAWGPSGDRRTFWN